MESFREAYGVLQRHAQALRNQDEPNIDDLLTIVTKVGECVQGLQAAHRCGGSSAEDGSGRSGRMRHGYTPAPPEAKTRASTPGPRPGDANLAAHGLGL